MTASGVAVLHSGNLNSPPGIFVTSFNRASPNTELSLYPS
jgi:hypothetical protein